MPLRWTLLSLLVVVLLSVPIRAAKDPAILDPAAVLALQKRWPIQFGLVQKRLAEPSGKFVRDSPAVLSAMNAAASFLAAEELPETARADARAVAARDFHAGLDTLGPHRTRFLSRDGGLGEIAREVLGAEVLLDVLGLADADRPEEQGLLSVRAEALYHAKRYEEAAAAALRAWELSRHTDTNAFALLKLSEGRTAPVQTGNRQIRLQPQTSNASEPPALPKNAGINVPRAVKNSGPGNIPVPGEDAGSAAEADRTPQRLLELQQATLSAWESASSDAPMPASALAPALDHLQTPIQRDLRLLEAAQASTAWLASLRDPKARETLAAITRAVDLPDVPRRRELSAALWRASRLMDGTDTAQADADIRDALMGGSATPEERLAAARQLDALRRTDPAYFKAKGAWLDYQGFVQGRLADFPPGARITSSELGLEPPPGSGLVGIEYETTKDGKLIPVRFTAADGSTRERADLPGAWSVRGTDGKPLGWSLDAASFIGGPDAGERSSSIASLARWLTERGLKTGLPQSEATYQNESLASLLRDILPRSDPSKATQIFVDRAQGRLAFDEFLDGAVRQKVARFERSPRGDGRMELMLYERTVKDPADTMTPFRRVMAYRGGADKSLLTEKSSVRGGVMLGTSVDLIPALVHYRRDEKGGWTRDGDVQELREQARVFHKSEGLIAGTGETIGIVGRGATDLTASVLAASGGLSLYGARVIPGVSGYAAELQRDWFERASVNLVHNAVSSELGQRYGGDDYRGEVQALNLDERKYIQNVRQELTDQGHPMLGAVTGAGVGVANGILPLAVGIGLFHKVATLGTMGELAANGVGLVMSGHGGWATGVSIREFARARSEYDAQDPASLAHYYTAVQHLTENAATLPLLLGGLDASIKARVKMTIPGPLVYEPVRVARTAVVENAVTNGAAVKPNEFSQMPAHTRTPSDARIAKPKLDAPPVDGSYEVHLDIDPQTLTSIEVDPNVFTRRMKIQRLYRKARFIEDTESLGISKQRIDWMFEKRCPLTFESPKQFRKFKQELTEALRVSGLPEGKARMKGTSTTFYSENPDKPLGHRFDADSKKPADIDINIEGAGMVERMKSAGLPPAEGDNPIFSTRKMMQQYPALKLFSEKWSAELKREVNFVGLSDPHQVDSMDWGL